VSLKKEKLNYEPLSLHEQRESFKRNEPVQNTLNEKPDPRRANPLDLSARV
jgi:hypothetical protein